MKRILYLLLFFTPYLYGQGQNCTFIPPPNTQSPYTWHKDTHWSCGHIPLPSDVVFINAPGNYIILYNQGVQQNAFPATITLQNAAVTLRMKAVNNGDLLPRLIVTGRIEWTSTLDLFVNELTLNNGSYASFDAPIVVEQSLLLLGNNNLQDTSLYNRSNGTVLGTLAMNNSWLINNGSMELSANISDVGDLFSPSFMFNQSGNLTLVGSPTIGVKTINVGKGSIITRPSTDATFSRGLVNLRNGAGGSYANIEGNGRLTAFPIVNDSLGNGGEQLGGMINPSALDVFLETKRNIDGDPTLTLNNNLNLDNGGTLNLDISCYNSTTSRLVDKVVINGHLTYGSGGRVLVNHNLGSCPDLPNGEYPLVTYQNATGTHANLSEATIQGFTNQNAYLRTDATQLTLVVESQVNLTAITDYFTTPVNQNLNLSRSALLVNDLPSGLPPYIEPYLLVSPQNGTLFRVSTSSNIAVGDSLGIDFIYIPNQGFRGRDSFVYSISDPQTQAWDSAYVHIDVNLDPEAVQDRYALNEDSILETNPNNSIDLNDVASGSNLLYEVNQLPQSGMLTDLQGSALVVGSILMGRQFRYVPNLNFNGTDQFIYNLVDDDTARSDTALVYFDVIAVNDTPVAVDDSFMGTEDTILNGSVSSNDTDVDSQNLTWTLVDGTTNGTVVLNPNGTFTYTPPANFNGQTTFTYRVSDGQANSNIATVTLTLQAVNDAPIAINDAYSTNFNTSLNIQAPGVLVNDSDVDSQGLTAVLVSGSANGAVQLNPNGSFTFTPTAGFSGQTTFTYRVSDGSLSSNTATVTITVGQNPNQPPVAQNDSFSGNEDSPINGNVLTNDSDPNQDQLVATLVQNVSQGTLQLNANGTFTYTPPANFSGQVTFTYRVSDGQANSNTATVTLTIQAVNDTPIAVNDSFMGTEDTVLNGNVSSNDTDVDSQNLTWTLVDGTTNGTVVLNPNGTFSFTPTANFNGQTTFTYRVSDGQANSNIATVTLTLQAVNDAPIAVNDAYSTNFNTALNIQAPGVLINDSDVDSQGLTAVSVSLLNPPNAGTLQVSANGGFVFTPASGFSGNASFTYRASDGVLTSNIGTVSITVGQNPNQPPVAQNDSFSGNEDSPISGNVLTNDSDPNQDPLTASLLTNTNNGTLVLQPDGSFTFTPNANYFGSFAVQYQVSDGKGGTAIANLTLTVNAVNDPPVAINDDAAGLEDELVSGNVAANDTDVDSANLTYSVVAAPTSGNLVFRTNGTFDFTPALNFVGQITFTYRVSDGQASSNIATVTLTFQSVNDAPIAVNDSFAGTEDTVLNGNVSTNDTDVDSQNLTFSLVNQSANGTVVLNPNGTFSFTPTANFNGQTTFTYRVSDGQASSNIATVTLTLQAVNDAPTAVNDGFNASFNTTLTIQAPGVLGNDSDVDSQGLTAVLVSGSANGAVQLNPNGSFTFTPTAGFSGQTTFTYRVSDGSLSSNTATVTITVGQNPNQPPVAQNDSFSGNEDSPINGNVLTNDSDPNQDQLVATLVQNVSQGTLQLNANGTFTYTPPTNFSGQVTFTYRVSDGQANSNIATVTLTLQAVNDAPIAVNDSFSGTEDTVLNGNVSSNDTDVDSQNLTWILVDGTTNGTVVLNPNGTFSFTPTANFSGQVTFTYRVSDGQANSNTATVTLTIQAVNDAPIAVNDSFTGTEDTVLNGNVSTNDTDVDSQNLTWTLVDGTTNGAVVLNPNGTFTYTPPANFSGQVTFTYRVSDGQANSNIATVTLTLQTVNDAPTAVNDAYSTNFNTALNIQAPGVLVNDTDVDSQSLTAVSVSLLNPPNAGTLQVNPNGGFTFSPSSGFTGNVSFTYQASDGSLSSNTATVTITVGQNPNQPPVAQNDSFSGNEDNSISGNVLTNDSDPNQDQLVATLVQNVSQGTLQLNGNGTFTYTPPANFNGQVTFTYRVSDGQANSNTATVTLTIQAVNDAPIAVDDVYTTPFNTALLVDAPGILRNDSDVDGDVLSVLGSGALNPPNAGNLSINSTGWISFSPNAGFSGLVTFTYTMGDGQINTTATVSITVLSSVNRPPVAVNDVANTQQGIAILIAVLTNDSDPDGNPITITATSNPSNGTVQIVAPQIRYTPNPSFNGADSFTYTISDGTLTATATVNVTVTGISNVRFTITEIPATKGLGVNDNGEVVGIVLDGAVQKAYKWRNETGVQVLSGLSHPSQALDVNENGEVVGIYRNGTNDRAFSWTSGSGLRSFETLGGDYSIALGINRGGTVVGASNTASGMTHAFKAAVGLSDIHTFTQNHSEAYAINLAGDIAGLVHDGSGSAQAFVNNNLLVGSTGTTDTRAYRINNINQTVGSAQQGTSVVGQFWNGTTTTALNAIGGGFAEAYGLNDSGWIVGASTTASNKDEKYTIWSNASQTAKQSLISTVATLWLNNAPVNLHTLLVNGTGWTLLEARDVNNRGQIVGYGRLNGQLKAFLLTPQNNAPVGKQDVVMDISQSINLLTNDSDADGDPLKILTVRGTDMQKVSWAENGEFRFLSPPKSGESYFYVATDGRGASIDAVIQFSPNVANDVTEIPTKTALLGNYPNPFREETNISYTLAEGNNVKIMVFDGLGRQQLASDLGMQSAGRYTHKLEVPNLSNGIYYYQLRIGNKTYQQRFVVLR